MKTLYELVKPFASVSFIGMCKNAGKTTTLNRLIRELKDAGVPFGATTIGRDGESTDVVTNTVKPGIFVCRGTVIATAANLLKYCDITKEVLDTTGIHTPMGEVVILRALSDGFVQLAGPSITTQLPALSDAFRAFGAQMVLIDGALGRKSLCSRKVSDSTILCTGASYHKDMSVVVRDTAYTCTLLQLPEADIRSDDGEIGPDWGKYIPLTADGCWDPEKQGKLDALWSRKNRNAPERVYVQGGLTDAMIRPVLTSNADFSGKTLVFKDGSRILVSADIYEKCRMKGLSFAVRDSIRLLGITINPFSAYGFHFEKEAFLEKMTEAVDVPVLNIREGEHSWN